MICVNWGSKTGAIREMGNTLILGMGSGVLFLTMPQETAVAQPLVFAPNDCFFASSEFCSVVIAPNIQFCWFYVHF